MRIREIFHQRPHLPYNEPGLENIASCRTHDPDAEQRNCETCGVLTCDECRIHLVFQDTTCKTAPNIWYCLLGYALLDSELRICWAPIFDDPADAGWSMDDTHNDLGYTQSKEGQIDMSIRDHYDLQRCLARDPDPNSMPETLYGSDNDVTIRELMESDLGTCRLVTDDEEVTKQLPFEPFNNVAQARKRFLCNDCAYKRDLGPFREAIKNGVSKKQAAKNYFDSHCHCTFKKHFFDRWICLKCHLDSWIDDNDYHFRTRTHPPGQLRPRVQDWIADYEGQKKRFDTSPDLLAIPTRCGECDKRLRDDSDLPTEEVYVFCSWCNGVARDENWESSDEEEEEAEAKDSAEESVGEDIESSEGDEDEDGHSADK